MAPSPHVRSPLKWIGGKYAAAPRIVEAFPASTRYNTYLEPCGGAAHVLMYKPPWGHREIYNDLNDDLYNFWTQMQQHADKLATRLQALPYSRALYYDYHMRLFNGSLIEPFERAVMWFYVLRSTGTGWIRESPGGWNNSRSNALSYRSALELFDQVQDRLLHPRVLLDNRDVERVIEEYDSPTTLHRSTLYRSRILLSGWHSQESQKGVSPSTPCRVAQCGYRLCRAFLLSTPRS